MAAVVIAVVPTRARADGRNDPFAGSDANLPVPAQHLDKPEPVPPQEGGELAPPAPPQEGGEQAPPVPPQEGGEQTPLPPPQEGPEQAPSSPPAAGGKKPAAGKEPAAAPIQPTPGPSQGKRDPSLAPTKPAGPPKPAEGANQAPPIPAQEGGEPSAPTPPPQKGREPVPPAPPQGKPAGAPREADVKKPQIIQKKEPLSDPPAPPKRSQEQTGPVPGAPLVPPQQGKVPAPQQGAAPKLPSPPLPDSKPPPRVPTEPVQSPQPMAPPQEGGEPTLPPQEGGDADAPPPALLPPQEGGDISPALPSQEGGDISPALPSQEGGDVSPPPPPQEGGEAVPTAPKEEGSPHGIPPTLPTPPAELPTLSMEPELPSAFEAPFSLTVNDVPKGEIFVVLAAGDVFVRRDDLLAAGVAALDGRDEAVLGQRLLSLKSVAPPLRYTLDEREIVLRIVAPIELLPKQVLNLAGVRGEVTYQKQTSGFFNYAAHLSDLSQLDLYQETGASYDGNLAFSSMYLSTKQQPIRGLTNFTLNERETRRRLIFGDALVQTSTLGSSYILGGWTLTKTFDLDPYAVRSPRIGFAGTTLTPAKVDVYVNGALVRTEQIQPGAFELNNLQVGGGKGLATYVIRDALGQEQRISIPFYVANSVLAKGFEEFTYSLGALREKVGLESWGYDRIAFMGTHRRGITDHLTLGGRLEATDRLISGGPALTAQTPIGQLELEVAASQERDGPPGLATFTSYSFSSSYFSAGAFGRLISDHYATLNAGARADRVTRGAGVYQATPLGKRMSLSSQGQISHDRDRGNGWLVNGSINARVVLQLNTSLSSGYTRYGDQGEWNVVLGLSYASSSQYFGSTQARITNGDAALDLNASRSLPIGPGYGFRANATIDEASHANAVAQYQTTFGRYSAGATVSDNGGKGPVQHNYTVDAAGGIAVVPGVGLFATLPINDSFGVIRVRGVKGVRGYISNKEIGQTDRNGNLVVPNVLSYYGNHISIDPEDIPIRYTVDLTDMAIAPPQRGVALADFLLTTPHYYRGTTVIDEHGKRVIPQYGQVRIPNEKQEILSPLGEAGEFDLEGLTVGVHQLFIDYAGGTCEMQLEATDSEDPVIDLGELVCILP